jgi:hypothetical protein
MAEGFSFVVLSQVAVGPGNPKDGVFERLARFPVGGPLSLSMGALLGDLEGFCLLELFGD